MVLVSACLAGINCRYNGSNSGHQQIKQLVEDGKAIPVCPEVLAGLTIPRKCCEMIKVDGKIRILTEDGEDLTDAFIKGAEKTWEMAKVLEIERAILQTRSPSCGYGIVYDGTFSGHLIEGNGFTAALLAQKGIQVYTELNFEDVTW